MSATKRTLVLLAAVLGISLTTTAAYQWLHPPKLAVPPPRAGLLGARSNVANNELQNSGLGPTLANDVYTKLAEHDTALDAAEAKLGTLTNGAEILASGATTGTPVSLLNVSGTKAYTLANGTYPGQTKRVECITAGSTPLGTLTVTTPLGTEPSSYLFDTVGQSVTFAWQSASSAPTTYGWHVIAKTRAGKKTFTVGTDNVAVGDLHLQIDLSIDGTKSSTFGVCQVSGEETHVTVSSGTNTPIGTLATTAIVTAGGGTVATGATALGATTDLIWFRCDGANWQEITSTGVTFSMLDLPANDNRIALAA